MSTEKKVRKDEELGSTEEFRVLFCPLLTLQQLGVEGEAGMPGQSG